MILVDDRVGSKDLLKPLQDAGLPATIARLEFADVAFQGKGPGGSALDIGVELKTLSDLVGSLRSGRLNAQVFGSTDRPLGLKGSYDYVWLIIEGEYRTDANGRTTTLQWSREHRRKEWLPMRGGMLTSEMEKRVLTLELCSGLYSRYTNRHEDTVHVLANLYREWTDTSLDKHQSHLIPHTAPTIVPVSKFRNAIIGKWPHIGFKTSKAVERVFGGSIRAACLASIEQWAGIETITDKGQARRLGVKAATEIKHFLEGQ